MKPGDFLFYALQGDTTSYVAEILSVDAANSAFTCREIDSGTSITYQYSLSASDPWQGEDGQGTAYTAVGHDVYTPAATDPTAQGIALVTFPDNNHFLCSVSSIDPTLDLTFYQQPCPKLSIENDTVSVSDWDAYPVGSQVACVESYTLLDLTVQPAPVPSGDAFIDGWWSMATKRPAYGARKGGLIQPFAVVVHTTDMLPDTFDGLINRWTTQYGQGDCAHFVIGRDATAGVIQLVPITNNANHAGAANACVDSAGNVSARPAGGCANSVETVVHGWFVAGQQQWHPNKVSVGIEVHCAGILRQVGGAWRLVEGGVAQGDAIPDEDVVPDANRAGIGYHVVTQYQYEQLSALLEALETQLGELPVGCVAKSYETPPAWGVFSTGRRVGHVSLDARDRGDPWPPTCDWMRTS